MKGMKRSLLPGKIATAVALVATALAAIVALAAASSASAFIYWANTQNQTIGRAENNGSGVNDNFIATGQVPFAVAVDSSHIYWVNQNSDSIGRANIDGTGVDNGFIAGVNEPSGVAVNATSIFWSTLGGQIGKANLDGSGKKPSFISGLAEPCGVALDSGHVYWAEIATGTPAYISRAGLDGFNKQLPYVTITGTAFPCGVAVNSANIFWGDPGIFGGGTRIGRATITGSGVDPTFIGDASTPCGLALDGSRLYWANSGTNTIARANTDGTAVDESFIATGGNAVCGVAVDGRSTPPSPTASGGPTPTPAPVPTPTPIDGTPDTTITKGPGKGLAEGIARFRFRSSEANSTFVCKLDGRKPVPCSSPRRYAGLAPGPHTFKVWAVDAAGNKDPTPAKRRFRVPA